MTNPLSLERRGLRSAGALPQRLPYRQRRVRKDALDVLNQLKQRNTPVALFLVDQRMPQMTGVELWKKPSCIPTRARCC